MTVVWAAIDDLKAEAEKAEPSREIVTTAITLLGSALLAIAKWVEGRATLTVDTCIKWGIPTVGGAYLVANPDKLQAVLDAAQKWLPFLN